MQEISYETSVRYPAVFETNNEEEISDEPKLLKWTKAEYYNLAELGFFEGKRTEFLEGEIIEMPTMNAPHATVLTLTDEIIRTVFTKDFVIRNQMPLDFGKDFEIVSDIVVIKGGARDFLENHPQTASLIIEVSDTTLSYDRNRKASLCAKNNIEDYWIVNVKDKRLEVFRRPIKDESAYYGFSYGEKLIFTEQDEVSPLAAPKAKIKVADLLP